MELRAKYSFSELVELAIADLVAKGFEVAENSQPQPRIGIKEDDDSEVIAGEGDGVELWFTVKPLSIALNKSTELDKPVSEGQEQKPKAKKGKNTSPEHIQKMNEARAAKKRAREEAAKTAAVATEPTATVDNLSIVEQAEEVLAGANPPFVS